MARPISWIEFVEKFHRAVSDSQRSLYDSGDLQRYLHIQPRTAQKLIGLMPRRVTGTLLQVERQDLAAFLERARDANKAGGDRAVKKMLEELTAAPPPVIKKKARGIVFHDRDPLSATSLPSSIRLACGRLEIRFGTVQELAEAMVFISKMMETEEFERLYAVRSLVDPAPAKVVSTAADLFDEINNLGPTFRPN